jgi:hypothetical protein
VDYNSLECGNPKEYFDIFTVENLTKLFPKVPGILLLAINMANSMENFTNK